MLQICSKWSVPHMCSRFRADLLEQIRADESIGGADWSRFKFLLFYWTLDMSSKKELTRWHTGLQAFSNKHSTPETSHEQDLVGTKIGQLARFSSYILILSTIVAEKWMWYQALFFFVVCCRQIMCPRPYSLTFLKKHSVIHPFY